MQCDNIINNTTWGELTWYQTFGEMNINLRYCTSVRYFNYSEYKAFINCDISNNRIVYLAWKLKY